MKNIRSIDFIKHKQLGLYFRAMDSKWWWKCAMLFGVLKSTAACNVLSFFKSCTQSQDYKIFNCTNVRVGSLKINYIPAKSKEIQRLSLVNTQLETLEANVLDSVPNLLYLNMSNNLLRNLDYNLFSNLKELRVLDLTKNKLNSLHDERLFKSQEKLSQLLLANNELTTLDISVLSPLTSVNSLALTGNPFNCNCQLRLIMIWCENRGLDTDATCEYPSKYRGYSWSVTNSSEICSVTETPNKVDLSEYMPTTEGNSGETAADEWNIGTSMRVKIIVYVCVTILLLCVATFILAYCWSKFKISTGREGTGDSVQHETNLSEDYYYYTNIELSQNMFPPSPPPVLPKRLLTNKISSKGERQRSNEPEMYNYAECKLEHSDTVTTSEGYSSPRKCSEKSELPPEKISYNSGHLGTDMLHRNTLYVQE
jgi:hypothetical protein